MTPTARLAAVALPILLGSCSQYTELSARFIDGRVAFVSLRGNAVTCVESMTVVDVASNEVMWDIGDRQGATCQAALPIRYGQRVAATSRAAKPLRPRRRYEVTGAAPAGNSMSGRFMLTEARAARLTDLP